MHRHKRSIWSSYPLSLLLSAAAGTAVCFLLAVFSALLLYKLINDIRLAEWLSRGTIAAGAFFGAYTGGKHRRRRGLAEGIICGAMLYLVLSSVSLICTGTFTGIKKLLLLTVAGAAGGVSGVNSDRPRNLMDQ